MSTVDPSNVLFKIAHPDLYERNPFNVLNLPVDATAKDIRRRKEDIEAAFDSGTEEEEFRNILPADGDRKMPTRADVEELFSALEDPEKRIAYSLFWFWPDASETPSGERRRSNPNGAFGHSSVIAKWEERARGSSAASASPTVAKHNLAMFHHMMGLAYELALRNYDIKTVNTPVNVPQHWKAAIYWWNDVSSQADFWHAVSENVSALDDPRVDYRFVRALRDQFAFAFDQINVELAIDFAKAGRDADAKRQVEYMKLSQPDSDDVEGSFDDAFSELLRQTETIVKTARTEAEENPKDGLKKANEILSRTNEPLRISRIVLEKGTPIRNAICTTIFGGVRNCLIIYGNNTKNWKACLNLFPKLSALSETPEQDGIVSEDEKLVRENIRHFEFEDTCCSCHKNLSHYRHIIMDNWSRGMGSNNSIVITMFDPGQKYVSLLLPLCFDCQKGIKEDLRYNPAGGVGRLIIKQQRANQDHKPGLPYASVLNSILSHPTIQRHLADGWRFEPPLSKMDIARGMRILEEDERRMKKENREAIITVCFVLGVILFLVILAHTT